MLEDFLARPDLLSLLIFTPLLGALLLAFIPGRHVGPIRTTALAISGLAFVISLLVALDFDRSTAGFQLVQRVDWIGFFGITYTVGVDGISLVLVLLTTLLTMVSILASFGASASSTVVVPRSPRFRLVVLLLRMCCLNAFERRNFPLFVLLKRFAAPRCVFSFGMCPSFARRRFRAHYLAAAGAAGFLPPLCGLRLRIVCI